MLGSFKLLFVLLTIGILSFACATSTSGENSAANVHPPSSDEVAAPPAECTEFQNLIDKTYDFKPTNLTEEQQATKSAEMDVIWEKVKADKKLIPCLTSALESPKANAFFRFDGSMLLYSLDQSDETKKLLIRSFAGADLEDMTLRNWIAPILKLGLEGFDTSKAGDAWLSAKDPFYYLPQHGTLKVDKRIGALAIYGSMDERFATPALAQIAANLQHPGRGIATSLLVMQVTPESLQALEKLVPATVSAEERSQILEALTPRTVIERRVGEPKISRAEYLKAFTELGDGRSTAFMELVSRVPDGEKDAVAVLLPEDIPLVRKGRRFFASTGTPHSPEWYQTFTDILIELQRKPAVAK